MNWECLYETWEGGEGGVETKKETDRQTDSLLLRYFCNVLFPILHTQEFRQVERLFKGGSTHGNFVYEVILTSLVLHFVRLSYLQL